jgi:hypothetical protein
MKLSELLEHLNAAKGNLAASDVEVAINLYCQKGDFNVWLDIDDVGHAILGEITIEAKTDVA